MEVLRVVRPTKRYAIPLRHCSVCLLDSVSFHAPQLIDGFVLCDCLVTEAGHVEPFRDPRSAIRVSPLRGLEVQPPGREIIVDERAVEVSSRLSRQDNHGTVLEYLGRRGLGDRRAGADQERCGGRGWEVDAFDTSTLGSENGVDSVVVALNSCSVNICERELVADTGQHHEGGPIHALRQLRHRLCDGRHSEQAASPSLGSPDTACNRFSQQVRILDDGRAVNSGGVQRQAALTAADPLIGASCDRCRISKP